MPTGLRVGWVLIITHNKKDSNCEKPLNETSDVVRVLVYEAFKL
jgi:hypothetical protein